jgi:hypothetical protein
MLSCAWHRSVDLSVPSADIIVASTQFSKEPSMRGAIRSLGIFSVWLGLVSVGCSSPGATPVAAAGATRTYYIAADEVTWDYAPMNRNVTSGKPFGAEEAQWVAPGPHKIGKEFKKAALSRIHRCDLRNAEAAADGMGAPWSPRPARSRGGRRHDQDRVQK